MLWVVRGPYNSVTAVVNILDGPQRQWSPLQVSQGDPWGRLGSQKDWFMVSHRCLMHLCKFRYFFLLGSPPSSPKAKAWHLHISKEWVWGIEKKKVGQYGKIGTILKKFPETVSARHDGKPADHRSGEEGRDGQKRNPGLLWMRPALVWDFACLFRRSWKTVLVSAQKTWLKSKMERKSPQWKAETIAMVLGPAPVMLAICTYFSNPVLEND